MKIIQQLPKFFKQYYLSCFFVFSFLIWLCLFREFISNKIGLFSDAIAYHQHFKYYFEHLNQGIYPHWDHIWYSGIPIEFFLRRIGSYNPLIFIVFIFQKLGMAFTQAYLWFLVLYYWLGMIGFYLISKRIFKDSAMAFLAYLLLMFSSLSTRLFDSYFLLTVIPMIWFFYFLIVFFQSPQKFSFLGIVFCSMVLLTTYVPFYFLTILTTFLVWFYAFYRRECREYWKNCYGFLKGNKLLVLIFCFILFVSLIPGYLFFQETKNGELLLPMRHTTSSESHQLTVGFDTIKKWGIEEDLRYSFAFTDLTMFRFAVLYIPGFIYIILLLGLFSRASKQLLFLLCWGGCLFVMFAHRLAIYPFLYEHIFYFKYFRNLHFFLWMIILPIFILFSVGQFKNVLEYLKNHSSRKNGYALINLVIHSIIAFFLWRQGDVIFSTYLVVVLSCLFFMLYLYKWFDNKRYYFFVALLILVVLQPVEVYSYLAKNVKLGPGQYEVHQLYLNQPETYDESRMNSGVKLQTYIEKNAPNTYFGVKWLTYLRNNLKVGIFEKYHRSDLLVYDRVEFMADDKIDLEKVGLYFDHNTNVAIISEDVNNHSDQFKMDASEQALVIAKDSKEVQVVKLRANDLVLKTYFNKRKFLVYNDSFHKNWRVFVNNKEAHLYRANIAFKGVWLPSGENEVRFSYGHPWRYVLDYFLLISFFSVFLALIISMIKAGSKQIPLEEHEF